MKTIKDTYMLDDKGVVDFVNTAGQRYEKSKKRVNSSLDYRKSQQEIAQGTGLKFKAMQ